MSDYYYNVDPAFNDTSDFIECDVCGSAFDYKEYKSATCSRCESNECFQCEEKLIRSSCPTETCDKHHVCPSCGLNVHREMRA
jgi:hypothetical protein